MRLGVATPVLTMLPKAHSPWEEEASIAEVVEVAKAADRLGYDHLTCSEHVAVPTEVAKIRGARYWDPLATLGYLAAHTERIRLATAVVVLGYHHPLAIAKRYGSLDAVSGGRLVLGVGVGSLEEEFDLLGASFPDRGARGDDALKALRAAFSEREPVYDGEFYAFRDLIVDPCAVQERVPVWVGGRTPRSLRRAVTLAEGWAPFSVTPEKAAEWLANVDVPEGFEVVLPPSRPLDPIGDPAATQEALKSMEESGVTIAMAWFAHHSLPHYLEQLEALAALHAAL